MCRKRGVLILHSDDRARSLRGRVLDVRGRRSKHCSVSFINRGCRCHWSFDVCVQELHAALPASSHKLRSRAALPDGAPARGRQFHRLLRPRSLDVFLSKRPDASGRSRIDCDLHDRVHHSVFSTPCQGSATSSESNAFSSRAQLFGSFSSALA